MKHILYLGWLGFNNLGDEYMWDVFRQLGDQHLDHRFYKITPSLPKVNLKNLDPFHTIVLGGGSLLIPGYLDIMYQAVVENKNTIIWGSGFDTLDRIDLSDGIIKNSHMIKTIDDQLQKKLIKIIEHSQFFGVRGPLTYQFLQHLQMPVQHITISGDPGMIYELPHTLPAPKKELVETKGKIIAINWGTSYNRLYGRNDTVVEDYLARAAQQLIKEGYYIYLYGVWGPDLEPLQQLYKKIGNPKQVFVDHKLNDTNSIIANLQQCAFSINFKLHANVISAVAGVPFICLGYRFKSFDFVYSLELPESILSTDTPNLDHAIMTKLEWIAKNKDLIIDRFIKNRNSFKHQLSTPFTQQLL